MAFDTLPFSVALIQPNYVLSVLDFQSRYIEHAIDVILVILRVAYKHVGITTVVQLGLDLLLVVANDAHLTENSDVLSVAWCRAVEFFECTFLVRLFNDNIFDIRDM